MSEMTTENRQGMHSRMNQEEVLFDELLLQEILNDLRPQLPIQNPIPFFVHNNPLQYWERYTFEEGMTRSCLLYERAGIELDRSFRREFEDIIIPVISSYLDQGMRRWAIPKDVISDSLWSWFCSYVNNSYSAKSVSFYKLKQKFHLWSQLTPQQLVIQYVNKRFSGQDVRENSLFYIKALLFHLKGWSGMIHLFEKNPRLYPLIEKPISLMDWLAILVLVENELNGVGEYPMVLNQQARQRRQNQIQRELDIIKQKEKEYYQPLINNLSEHVQTVSDVEKTKKQLRPQAISQIFFCIDDREEALRRILEKINPQIQTFGTVGFFGIDVAIKSDEQLIFQPFCPPVIQPRKRAIEKRVESAKKYSHFKGKFITSTNHTRFTIQEPLLALLLPLVYFFSLLLRTLKLEIYHSIKKKLLNLPDKAVDFQYEFLPDYSYSIQDKAKIVLDILASAGLKDNFAPVVMMLAHGASTTNNPFQKSYGCGACSGQSGYPNAKIFCEFANDPEVRNELAQQGYVLPASTQFVAAHHDTCSDELMVTAPKEFSQLQQSILDKVKADFSIALKENTHYRFGQFGIDVSESAAHRSLDWSQPRPEYGHSRVALAVFGPRELTANLNLDRRSFLVSYDPKTDVDGKELEYVIMSALPVCANINLDYFTSCAFPNAFGSGSKLPMNIAAGIGLMTGSKSDLRIGLARQMVDKHEALRILSFVCAKKEHLESIISKSTRLTQLVKNQWIHLVRIDPDNLKFEAMTQDISEVISNARI